MTIWFISDTHFSHENIIRYAGRPFSNADAMNEAIVERWNSVVKPGDHVYHLGDVAFSKPALQIVRRLKGTKRLILGNHDTLAAIDYNSVGFQKILGARVFDGILFTHYPIHPMSAGGDFKDGVRIGRIIGNAHGHIHERDAPKGPYVNLSVEHTNYTPVSLEEVKERMNRVL